MEQSAQQNDKDTASRYTGGAVTRKLISWVAFIVSLITLSLANPAMVCWKQRWECKHTYIDGNRLVFDGKAIQLFGKYITWLLLCLVTFGIYLFWLSVKKQEWITKHTHFMTEGNAETADEAEKRTNKKADLLAAMSPEERAAYEEKVNKNKRTAHMLGLVSIILAFFMPPWGFILGVVAVVFGAVHREKFGLRSGTCAVSVVAVLAAVLSQIIMKSVEHLIFVAPIAAGIAVIVCVTVFMLTRKWESVSIKNDQQ